MKTPEEIDRLELLAASYACDYRDSPNKTNGIPDSYLVYSIAYDAFLDGYKAAMDQLADADNVINSPEKPDSWFSVKERLPGVGAPCLVTCHEERYTIAEYDGIKWTTLNSIAYYHATVTHWMPLPALPKEDK